MTQTTFRTVRDRHGAPLPAVQPLGAPARNAAVAATPWVVDVTTALASCVEVLTYGPIRFATGTSEAAAIAALTANGTGADRGRPAGFWLVAFPSGHTHLAIVRCSQAGAGTADVTVEIGG